MSKGKCIRSLIAGKSLKLFPEFVDDKEAVLIAVQKNGLNLRYASAQLKDDEEVVFFAIKEHIQALEFASHRLKGNKRIVMACMRQQQVYTSYTHMGVANDNGYLTLPIHYTSAIIKADRDVIMAAVGIEGLTLRFASENLQSNKEIVMRAVRNSGTALEYASDALKLNEEIVTEAIKQDGMALSFSPTYMGRIDLCKLAVQSNPRIFGVMNYYHDDKEIALLAVGNDPSGSGEDLMMEFVSDDLKKDRDVVMKAVTTNGFSLAFVDESLQDDETVVTAAINENGRSLQFASPRLKKDRGIVMTAITQDEETGPAILDADPSFNNDRDALMSAIEHDGGEDIYEYASDRCKMDLGLIIMLYEKEEGFLEKLPEEAWTKPNIIDWASHIPEEDIPEQYRDKVRKLKSIEKIKLPGALKPQISSYLGGKTRRMKRKNKSKKSKRQKRQ